MQLTRERLERAATENQFMNGKIAAMDVSLISVATEGWFFDGKRVWIWRFSYQSYRQYLDEALGQSFPELIPHLQQPTENPSPPNAGVVMEHWPFCDPC